MKVLIYIDGEHNTVEVKDKIKSVLPDANYMIFDHTESKGKVTNYERIKDMSVEEMAEENVSRFGTLMVEPFFISCLDMTCHKTKEDAIKHNREYLESEAETE